MMRDMQALADPPPGRPLLSVTDAAFAYSKDATIFEGLGFTLEPGEVLCVLGPNGTGKSTLLRCLLGLQPLSAGAIRLRGENIQRLARAALGRAIGFVPQSNTPVFAFPVGMMVEMGRAAHLGWTGAPSKADRTIARSTLQRLRIEHLADRLYPELSGGEQQMVLLARALAQQPSLLVLDEPTAHLDFANQADTLALVRGLADEGRGVIMTTHDPAHAFLVADRVLVMARGRPPSSGPTATVLTESLLSATYGRAIRLVQSGDRTLCFALTGADANAMTH